jgi:hypothetical protein|tara:strand:+ start:953 stop:1081 length:129 start_codon:yes stop_codon:yes gene_type:complete
MSWKKNSDLNYELDKHNKKNKVRDRRNYKKDKTNGNNNRKKK